MPRFCVVIPCYNAEPFLNAAVASLQAQDTPDWEVIIVDDGSSDATAAIAARLAQADHRIRFFSQANAGVSAARNLGAGQAAPECGYLWFLDADDLLVPGALRRMGDYLDRHPEVGLLGCQFQVIGLDGSPLAERGGRSRWAPGGWLSWPRQLTDGELPTPFESFFCGTGQGPFALYRREVFARTDGWDAGLRVHEDTDMFCQMALLGEVHYLPDRLYFKRVHDRQSTHLGDDARRAHIWSQYDLFRRKWDERVGRDDRQNRVLARARAFYRNRFEPCRDLKLVVAIWRDTWRGKGKWAAIWYSFKLTAKAIRSFLRPVRKAS